MQGQLTACKSNLKNLGTAVVMYATDNGGNYPAEISLLTPRYLKAIPTCPACEKDTYSASYERHLRPDDYTVYCGGTNHVNVGYSANYPQFSSASGLIER